MDCGSQVILCDLPIRFDTYRGCSHRCVYCFVTRSNKNNLSNIKKDMSVNTLKNYIAGQRNLNTAWVEKDFPFHWGGMSDPFQRVIESKEKISLECLKVLAETKYPFIVSTKSTLIFEEPYLSLLNNCNCVIQISAVCEKYDKLEPGTEGFLNRIKNIPLLKQRVIIRAQPYFTFALIDLIKNIKTFNELGAYGVILEGAKLFNKTSETIRVGGDQAYKVEILKDHFERIKNVVHKYGMKFYSGENRLRTMGDNPCCCGVEGLGFKTNKTNLNHIKEGYEYSIDQKKDNTAHCFSAIHQRTSAVKFCNNKTFAEIMEIHLNDPKYKKIMV